MHRGCTLGDWRAGVRYAICRCCVHLFIHNATEIFARPHNKDWRRVKLSMILIDLANSQTRKTRQYITKQWSTWSGIKLAWCITWMSPHWRYKNRIVQQSGFCFRIWLGAEKCQPPITMRGNPILPHLHLSSTPKAHILVLLINSTKAGNLLCGTTPITQ